MGEPIIRVISTGLGVSIQDLGRIGWKRFGVPPSGVMDRYAAAWANRLAGNPDAAPVLEILMQGTQLMLLGTARVALAGAEAGCALPSWHGAVVPAGTRLDFPRLRRGLWSYLAVEGGFDVPIILGSSSSYPRGKLGTPITPGTVLLRRSPIGASPMAVASRWASREAQRNYDEPPALLVWPGSQWDLFDEQERRVFLSTEWQTSTRSDRVGYRLEGARLNPPEGGMLSEPVVVGSIQVPRNGQPIVTMRDGPTVGGYPKIAVLDPASLCWLAQCRPCVRYRFSLVE